MIPARLLIHSCQLSKPNGTDRDGNAIYINYDLQRVRLGPVELSAINGTAGEAQSDKLTLWVDPKQTTPAIVPAELDRVTWNGKTYTVRAVTPCYTHSADTVHHYEAALV